MADDSTAAPARTDYNLTILPHCPGCGRALERCPCCGREYPKPQPYYPCSPFYPTWPVWAPPYWWNPPVYCGTAAGT